MACIFCKIASGEIPSEKVGENARAFAFLDIRPLVKGHVLVIPKAHAERFGDMAPEDAAAVGQLAAQLTKTVEKAVGAHGVTIGVNDGRAAGQEVMHVHVHLVPRTEGDGHGPIHGMFGAQQSLTADELKRIGALVRGD